MKNVEDVYAASPLQQGLIFHGLYAPESSAYAVQMICELEGRLDAEAFRSAWQRVFDRYHILRTFFIWGEANKVLQVVKRRVEVPWEELDWRGRPAAEQEAGVEELAARDRVRGFDFRRAPLVRMTLVRMTERRAKLLWCHHHSLLDGWSAFRVFRDAFEFYESSMRGRPMGIPAPRPYKDYIEWLGRQDMGAAERYWRERLAGFADACTLTRERRAEREREPLSEELERQEHRERVYLSTQLASSLKLLAKQHQLTLNTVMAGAWALLLSRYGGSEDVVFGTVVSGRPPELEGVEEMVGPFINLLPVRVRVEGGEALVPWLRRLQREQLEMRDYEYSPLAEVQGWSDVPRGVPLFDSMMVFENYPIASSTQKREVTLQITRVKNVEKTNYPLTFEVVPAGKLAIQLSYDPGYFTGEQVRRMLGHLSQLLAGMAADPKAPLRRLRMLTPEERRLQLVNWNDTSRPYPAANTLDLLFREQAERTPEATAVSDHRGLRLTYRELDERSNRLARHLIRRGAGPEVPVGVLMERSVELVVALLGVLKSGAAYLPLDPEYPVQRLLSMIEDAGINLLLTQEHLLTKLPETSAQLISLDGGWDEIAGESPEGVETNVEADNLAYVIYTSGSTGQPKGAMNTHRGICNRLLWMQEAYGLKPEDRVLQKTPYSFDVSVWEFFWPLIAGARLVFARPGGHRDAAYLVGLIKEEQITVLHFVPSMLQVFLEEDGVETCTSLRHVVCSGEALPHALQERFHARMQAELHNLYGPTEASVDVTRWDCERDSQRRVVPIGRPIANTQIYILDGDMEPLPVGATGELYIGGVGVGRGYLKRAGLTAERFVPHPFGDAPGARLYRTGDIARFLPTGDVEFLGRRDDQVKIRGFRIEPGEVEATLSANPSVRECVVVADSGGVGQRRLVAYVVAATGQAPTGEELRHYLRERLPDYMVPAAFVLLDSLPLTSNGKLDRRALPAPESAPSDGAGRYVEPRTEAERVLAEVWAQVLGRERVGVEENFFELGGDSILSIQVVARAGRSGLRLTPRLLFEHPTVAGLAAAAATPDGVSHAGGGGQSAEDDEAGGEVELTPVQHWFFSRALRRPHHFNQSSLLRLRSGADPELLRRALQHLSDYHGALRLRFTHDAQGWRSRYAPEETLSFRLVDLGHIGDAAGRRAAIESEAAATQASLNLESGPLLRAVYFDCGEGEPARLLLVIHHLAVDGVSWRILLDDLERAYGQLAAGERVDLGPKTTSYRRWSEALAALAHSEEMREELEYWAAQPWASAARLSEAGRGGDNGDSGSGAVEAGERLTAAHRLTEEETEALLREAPGTYHAQMDEVLLAALGRALGRAGVRGEVVVELEGHGREEVGQVVDVSRTVGWFTSVFPMLLRADGGEEMGAALRRVKGRLRGVPRKGLGYGVLKYLSQDEGVRRRMSDIPEASVVFNYLGQFGAKMGTGGVLIEGGAEEGAGATQWEGEACDRKVTVNSAVVGGRLEVRWGYGEGARWAEGAAEAYVEELRGLAAGRRGGAGAEALAATALTASDFPLAKLDERKLGKLSTLLDKLGE